MSTRSLAPALPRRQPETEGVNPAGISAFLAAVDRDLGGLHGFMLLRHGRVLAEGAWTPYAPELPHQLFSLTKSFASTAVGLAVAEGRLTVDTPVLALFPAQAPTRPGDNLLALRVRHLLTMTTGHHTDPTGAMTAAADGDWVRAFLAQPIEHEPGTYFVYNSGASHLLAAIVTALTGQDLREYLRPRLFEPLGIAEPAWETCPRGVRIGGWGLSLRLEDIARFGQLYLQRGQWRGRRLLPEAWIADATARQVANGPRAERDWEQGYGYQFWRCQHGAFRGDGAFGQFCVVLPEQEAVIAMLAGTGIMQAVLDRVWEHLLPAFGPSPRAQAPAARRALKQALAGLRLPVAVGSPTSELAPGLAGTTFRFAPNSRRLTALTFRELGADTCALDLTDERGEHRLVAAHGRWLDATTTLGGWRSSITPPDDRVIAAPVAGSYAWTSPDTLQLKLCFPLTPFCPTYTLRFAGDRLVLQQRASVAFGPPDSPELEGRRG